MKGKKRNSPEKPGENPKVKNQDFDDSLRPLKEGGGEEAKIFKISKRGNTLNRKKFISSATSITGLAALGTLLRGCEESELEIVKNDKNCTCHAVCTCNSEVIDGNKYDKGDRYESFHDVNQFCTCDTVCTCNSVCTCDSVSSCDCDSDSGGGGGYSYYYTYWYPC
jgi:hypothetical protein